MLVADRRVLQRHVEAAELDHARPGRDMPVVERSSQGHGLASVVRSQTASNDHCPHRRGGRGGRPLRRSAGRAPSHLRRVPAPGARAARGCPGIAAEVTVGRDRWGVPHVNATSMEDAAFADGGRPRPGPAVADGGYAPGRDRSDQRVDRDRRRQHRPFHPPGRAPPRRPRRGAPPRSRGAPDAQGVRGRSQRDRAVGPARSRSSTASSA